MEQPSETKALVGKGQYDANYGNFQVELYEQVRREAFGEDIGQNSWLTADEQDKFLNWLALSGGMTLLDAGCGAGGPVLRAAARSGCSVVGVDAHEQAISTAHSLAAQRGLSAVAKFFVADMSQKLAFPDATFEGITCIDAINHFPDRRGVIAEWARLLKPGGRLLFTDPIIVTGPLTNAEISVRSATGFYLFVPPGYDETILAQCGLRLLVSENRTRNMAEIAERRRAARASRSSALREIEGHQTFERQQEFLSVAARTASENRLSRFVYVAEKAR
jgi:2-polyprenyl-3-methyl-5-hydroxy-6-metoxy-1,4-benzoquinol methylase